ncbi:uncharacterized protein LOC126553754 [Aphis gossypii]|uniref:uncharacterized protein LOC126553754 n=1 Tax=Aphis gossypii TaxID=80765 RepID=UPI0021593BC3|nr:uncharacterized protein LOC126553754 [Aphis gossypii]
MLGESYSKLKEGVTWEHILDFIREGEITDDTNKRILLLERQDLTNISRDFNINYATRRHKDDAVSVDLWVNELKNQLKEDCPILYYKAQDKDDDFLEKKDFALIIMTKFQAKQILKFGPNKICIDGTHGTNAYDIQLYTIMTVDEYGTGCPVAFCFSNRVGIIKSKVFMSDDAPAFYNAWVNVMGPAEHRLLCTWHVDRNWRDNLSKISGGSEKKSLVYKTLRVLLQMISIDEFKISLDQFINDLLADKDTEAFGSYFVQHYSKRTEVWAYCYLMKLARDSMFKRLIRVAKNGSNSKSRKIHESHKSSELISSDKIQILEGGQSWIVNSLTNPSENYCVAKADKTCNEPCLKCSVCNICIHTFTCECIDNIIKLNICKHIHACAQAFNKLPNDSSNAFYLEDATIGEQEGLIEMISQPSMKCTTLSTPGISGKIINKVELIRSLCATSEPTVNETNAIRDGIDSQNNEYVNIHQTFDHGYL